MLSFLKRSKLTSRKFLQNRCKFDTLRFATRVERSSQMTQKKVEITGNGLFRIVGLVRHAYSGAPKGVAQVDLTNPELRSRMNRWELKTKTQRKQDIIDNL